MSANAEAAVTQGSLQAIYNYQSVDNPVLQCVQLKPMGSGANGVERFRIVLSDVKNYIQSMLATQLNHVVKEDKLRRGSFLRLKQFQQQEVKGKRYISEEQKTLSAEADLPRILIVLDCDILEELGEREKIGSPQPLEGGAVKEEEQTQSKPTAQPNGISGSGFYGNDRKPPQQQQQQNNRSLPTRGPSTSSSHGNIYPIEALSPYAHKWTIKARCTFKSEIKTWHNKNGEGKLFSVNFLDESGEIRATGFNAECDMLYENIQEGSVYYVSSPCRVQLAKKQFSNVNNDYELTFERDTQVEKAEDQTDVPKVKYNFTDLAQLENVEKDTTIDVMGVLKDVGEVSQIVSKTTSKPYDKRELTLVDNTGRSVRLTIWGGTATSFDAPAESVVAFKGVKVSDFGGRSLSLLSSGSMAVDPDIDEAHRLKGWYDAQGGQGEFVSYANMGISTSSGRKEEYKTIAGVRDDGLGMTEDKTDYFTLKATVVYVKADNISYPACRTEGCNKKLIENNPGEWRCEKCDKTFDRPEYRYVLSVNVSDYTGQLWISCFDDVGRVIMGMTADELTEYKESNEKLYQEKIQEANCKSWIFACRAKMDNFQEQQRVRYQVSRVSAINFSMECSKLADIIKQYALKDENSMFVD